MIQRNHIEPVDQCAFEDMAKHMLTQGQRSTSEPDRLRPGGCLYRAEGGLMCAVGALIADSVYEDTLEQQSADDFEVYWAVEASGYDGVSEELLIDMQAIHDRTHPADWPKALYEFAQHCFYEWSPELDDLADNYTVAEGQPAKSEMTGDL